nr:ribonuclease M5 [Heliobacterium chlorum]
MEKERIAEVIVVEGRDDLVAVKRAVDAEVIITQGLGLSPKTLQVIKEAQQRCGVIVFTDPDGPGERIRRWVTEAVPGVKHAFLPAAVAKKEGKVGIEHARLQDIRVALNQVRSPATKRETFNRDDLRIWKVDGVPGAGQRREALGEKLGIGRVNAKQFLQRINHFGLGRGEIEDALKEIGEVPCPKNCDNA